MRASSLSDPKVITLLNRYFVPVYVSTEQDGPGGSAPPEERAEYSRIYREALNAQLSPSTVNAYVLTLDGHPLDSMHVKDAYKPENLIPMLEKAVRKLQTPPGTPLIPPAPQSQPPAHD